MNIYGIVILATIVASYLLGTSASLLNLRSLRPDLPGEFQGVLDPVRYRRSQDYTRARTHFSLVSSTFSVAVLLGFWFIGGFAFLDLIVRDWAGPELRPIVAGLLYVGLLTLGRQIIGMPFRAYSTFVLEERFGFNRTRPATFFLDMLKGLVLLVAVGGPVLAALLYLFAEAGQTAWLYSWGVISVVILAVNLVFPTWILPLFNKFTPLTDGDLKDRILDYARSVDFPISNIFIADGSRRSSKSNAFFAGFGRTKRLALYDTLVERHGIAELVAVVAHEVGHSKKRHLQQGLLLSIAHSGLLLFLLSLFVASQGLFDAFFIVEGSVYVGLVLFGLLYTPVEILLAIILNRFSRRNELQADRFAATTIEDPEQMVAALKTLSVDNLANLTPHRFHVLLHASHPPVLERIGAIRRL